MPVAQITNPLGVNAPQGNEVYTASVIVPFASDPAANVHAITGMTTANPTVITTAAHGYISGQQVNINASTAWSATGTLPAGNYTATVLSTTTFSIPFNYTGTYTSGGSSYQLFQPGQVCILQSWNGSVSGAASAPVYPTVALTPITTAVENTIGVIVGGQTLGSIVSLGGVAQVCIAGQCQIYSDVTTTIGAATSNIGASVARPGASKPLTATTGYNLGVYTQVVTVTNAYIPQLAWAFIRPS